MPHTCARHKRTQTHTDWRDSWGRQVVLVAAARFPATGLSNADLERLYR